MIRKRCSRSLWSNRRGSQDRNFSITYQCFLEENGEETREQRQTARCDEDPGLLSLVVVHKQQTSALVVSTNGNGITLQAGLPRSASLHAFIRTARKNKVWHLSSAVCDKKITYIWFFCLEVLEL